MAFSLARHQLRIFLSPRKSAPRSLVSSGSKIQNTTETFPKSSNYVPHSTPSKLLLSVEEFACRTPVLSPGIGILGDLHNLLKSPISKGTLLIDTVSDHHALGKNEGSSDQHPSVDTPNRKAILKHGSNIWKKWNKLGQGSFGTVVQACYKGENVALKLIPLQRFKKSKASLLNEQNAIGLSHPNIIRVLQVIGNEDGYGMVIMERCVGTDMQKLVQDVSFELKFNRRLSYAIDIASAVQYCHSNQLLHLDIKPQNILIGLAGTCKLSDFGSSRILGKQQYITNVASQGTVIYTDPDILRKRCASKKSDVYSFGITLWQLLSREIPYSAYNMHLHTLIYKVVSRALRPRNIDSTLFEQADEDYRTLYKLCWHQNANERPNMFCIVRELERIRLHDLNRNKNFIV